MMRTSRRCRAARNMQSGFTIIEMMVALSVLAVILLITATVVTQFNVSNRRALTQATTQTTARAIQAQVSDWLQFTNAADVNLELPGAGLNSHAYCIGEVRISYTLGLRGSSGHALVSDRANGIGCSTGGIDLDGSVPAAVTEHVGPNMRLSRLDISEVTPGSGLFHIAVRVVYGQTDMLCAPGAVACDSGGDTLSDTQLRANAGALQCKNTRGSEFCAVSELTTTVKSRL